MLKKIRLIILFPLIVISCSTGKKALQKGNYYDAITKAAERLKSDPGNEKAQQVLIEGYPQALQWWQEELDVALSSNQPFKWEQCIDIMQNTNRLSKLIRRTPAARKIITEPKSYSSELSMAYEKAAEERYQTGLGYLKQQNREAAKTAFNHFKKCDQLVPGYNDVSQKMETAKEMATLNVVIEAITVNTQDFKLSTEFFYNQVFEYVNNQFPSQGFVRFLSPKQAETYQIQQPDFIMRMEFFDFSVGNINRHEKEEQVVKQEEVAVNDTTTVTKTYRAKLKTYTDEVISNGRLRFRIIDFNENKLIRDKLIPGAFTWVNQYAIFAGDKKALNEKQFNLTKNKVLPLPPHQDLFIEFTRPIYEQLTNELTSFFRRYR